MNAKNIRITRPNTGIGGKRICIYNDQGEDYLPGWQVIWGSGFMGENSGLDADKLDGKEGSEYLIDLTGSIHLFATAVAPVGFLKANGAEVSRTSYAKLFEKIGTTYGEGNGRNTFNIPNLRGEFLRCNDDGRGVDVGRVLGSWQSDENKAHAHTINGQNKFLGDVNGDSRFDAVSGHSTGDDGNWFSMPLSGGGSEARPRNISLLAYIKY
jgi:microcystin-dependent protein